MRLQLLFVFVIVALSAGCSRESDAKAKTQSAPSFNFNAPPPGAQPRSPVVSNPQLNVRKIPPSDPKKEVTTRSGLKYQDLDEGTGPPAKKGDRVEMHYTGWLSDGSVFESSLNTGKPFAFKLGGHQAIEGWDEGIPGMKVGGRRKLTIPSNLGYGEQGSGPIPPNADLIFEVELVKIY